MSLGIFLAGPFHSEEEENRMERIYSTLSDEGHKVWWAREEVDRGYGTEDEELWKEINEIEEEAIEKSDILVPVVEKASFGTAMEIKHAYDNNVPVISYELSDHPHFESSSYRLRIAEAVKSENELLEALQSYE